MAKGQMAILVLVLVVIGAVVYFALPMLQNLPSGGGFGIGEIPTNNNIVTIEGYSVSSLKMFPGEQTVVSFIVQNNGDHAVSNIEVNFYDLGGMIYRDVNGRINMLCQTDAGMETPQTMGCTFTNVKPFDSRRVVLTLQSPNVASSTTFKLSYSVKYPYIGSRSAVIPVVDGLTRTTPLGKFSESKSAYSPDSNIPSYGPVQLSYKPPVGGTTKQGNQVINEYWGVNNQPFRLELEVKHVGTVEGAQPVRLKSIALTPSSNLRPSSEASNNFCPIIMNGINRINSRLDNENQEGFVGPRSVSDITSKPLTLNCQFTPDIGSAPESNAEVSTVFEYDYIFQRSETFTVQPFEQKR
jgi:hypothetical protein